MKDVSGRELAVGDYVAVTDVGYTGLLVATIRGFSEKKVLITLKSGSKAHKFPDQVCRIDASPEFLAIMIKSS